MQVKIVGLRVFRARAGIEKAAFCANRRQQSLTYLGSHLRLHRDQVLRGRGHVGLPQQPVSFHLDRLERNQKMVALLQKVSGKNAGNVQFPPRLLRIDVVGDIFSRNRRGTNVQRPGVSKRVGNFIGQRKAQKLHADIAIHILQRQYRNGVLPRAARQLALFEPPRPNRDQNREQHRADSQQKIW